MNFILEYKNFYKEGDIVLIEYWYNDMITPVKILEKKGYKFLVSHDVPESEIQNAPNETIKRTDIISEFRKGNHLS